MNPKDELVYHFMSTPVVALPPTADVRTLLRLSERLSIHHFPLIDVRGLRGVVCTCDLEGAQPQQSLVQFVRRSPVTVHPRTSLEEAAARMAQQGVGSVLVADEEEVWGILTREDVAATAPELMQRVHCVYCGSRQHLHTRADEALVCPLCASRDIDAESD
jgi:transcriptional regulator